MRTSLFLSTLILAVTIASRALADGGGPPIETDDPGTPGDRKWEINGGFVVDVAATHLQVGAPAIDFNYGVGENVQLKFETETDIIHGTSGTTAGIGYSKVGVKWRFLDEEKNFVSVSIYPQLIFNSPVWPADGKANAPLQLLIPVEVFKTINKTELMGEVGINIVSGQMAQLLYALALGYKVSDRIEILGELHGLAALDFKNDDELDARVGARITISKALKLMFSAGHSLRVPTGEEPSFMVYVGVQYTP